jgi:alpha-N-arabinofuranosidase
MDGQGVPGISASAAKGKDGKTYIALVNTNPHEATDVVVNVAGQNVGAVRGQLLTADAMDAHNTFERKDAVKPVPFSANASGGKLTIKVPAKSVLVVAVEG